MLPQAYVSHVAPGRVRIRIPSRKRNSAFFSSLQNQLSQFPGIQKIEVNDLTGSILVLHDLNMAEVSMETVSRYTEMNGLFQLQPVESKRRPVSSKITALFRNADEKVKGFTGGEVDIPSIAFLSLLGVGVLQIARGKFVAPAWSVAFWYAAEILIKSQTRERIHPE